MRNEKKGKHVKSNLSGGTKRRKTAKHKKDGWREDRNSKWDRKKNRKNFSHERKLIGGQTERKKERKQQDNMHNTYTYTEEQTDR
jgi:hypothetical protein